MGGATFKCWYFLLALPISIHAPRGGSDFTVTNGAKGNKDFNPRSPWGERPNTISDHRKANLFQSTLPVGGATILLVSISVCFQFQSTLPVGGATCLVRGDVFHDPDFNPRSPWGERPRLSFGTKMVYIFQSTLPVGGATDYTAEFILPNGISIHAPRGGSDNRAFEFVF